MCGWDCAWSFVEIVSFTCHNCSETYSLFTPFTGEESKVRMGAPGLSGPLLSVPWYLLALSLLWTVEGLL